VRENLWLPLLQLVSVLLLVPLIYHRRRSISGDPLGWHWLVAAVSPAHVASLQEEGGGPSSFVGVCCCRSLCLLKLMSLCAHWSTKHTMPYVPRILSGQGNKTSRKETRGRTAPSPVGPRRARPKEMRIGVVALTFGVWCCPYYCCCRCRRGCALVV